MKKIIIILILLTGISTNIKAQWYFGGGIGLGAGPNSNLSINISPEAGYRFSDYFTVGGRLSYTSAYNRLGFDPYVRAYMLKRDFPVRFAVSMHAPMFVSQNYFDYGIYAQPGISIAAGPNIRFECHLGAFGWGATRSGGALVSSGWNACINGNNSSIGIVFYR